MVEIPQTEVFRVGGGDQFWQTRQPGKSKGLIILQEISTKWTGKVTALKNLSTADHDLVIGAP